jgi:hypothetical protein
VGATTPPPISAGVAADSSKPTSAIVNVIYAAQYPLKSVPASGGLATGTKIGIGVGAGAVALLFGILALFIIRQHRAHKRVKTALEEMSGIGSTRQSVVGSSAFGGVKDWQKNVSPEVSSGLEPVQEPSLPQVVSPPLPYVSDAQHRPGHRRTMSPPISYSGYYSRSSIPSPPIPEGYSEGGSETGYSNNRVSGGYMAGNRSELHSGEYEIQRQELQGGYGAWQHQGEPQVTYYEVPTGRMTPGVPPAMPPAW